MANSQKCYQHTDISEEEVASAIACVLAFIAQTQPQKASSAWQVAAQLEATGVIQQRICTSFPSRVAPANIRLAARFMLLLLCLITFASTMFFPAVAGEEEPTRHYFPPQSVPSFKPGPSQIHSASKYAGPLQNPLAKQDESQPDEIYKSTTTKIQSDLDAHGLQESKGLCTTIRVCLYPQTNQLSIEAPDGARLCDFVTGVTLGFLPPGSTLTIGGKDGELILSNGVFNQSSNFQSSTDCPLDLHLSKCIVSPSSANGFLSLNGVFYRGQISLQILNDIPSQFMAINILELEDYLLSVVPAEMPSNWPLEALKAQAVAARSYAVANMGKNVFRGYDVKATVEDQVYLGIMKETERTTYAVAQTKGLVVKHLGKVASTFFHSTSGGCTEVAEFVWGKSIPFLQSVPDYDSKSPFSSWQQTRTVAQLEQVLCRQGHTVEKLLALLPITHSPSGRVTSLMAVGNTASYILTGEEFRHLANLPSANFNLCHEPNSYLFIGHGAGHGLGLSQWGAKTMAEFGYNAAQILTYYYKNVSLDYL